MQLQYTPAQQKFRHEVRDWMAAHVPKTPLVTLEREDGYHQHVAWERTLASGNWGMVTWPVEYGGRGLDLIEWLIFEEEYWAAGAPARANQNGIFLLGPTIMDYGTPEQKARFLTPMAKGEVIWAQAWSEPGAGSDMAAITTKAIRDGDHYVINGQKTWSSRAAYADWGFGLFRTDPESKRHKGLSFILFDLNTPGVTRRPIRQLHGDTGFAELFFDDVRVPVENCLAGVGEGWNVAMATAGFERGLMLRAPGRFQATAKRLVELFRQHEETAAPAVREAVLTAWMGTQAYAYNTYAVAAKIMAGGKIGAEASLNKIFWSELDRMMHRTAMQLLGAAAELRTLGDGGINAWLDGYIFSLSGPIYAGSNEIQRNITAERLLGLPRVESRLMDLLLTPDQLEFAESVRTYLAGTHGPDVLRRLDAGPNRDPAIWQGLVDMGLTGLCVPEAHGGLGLGLLEAALIAVECGRFALAEPLVDTAFVAAPLLASTPGNDEILTQIAAGTARIALSHPVNPWIADADTATHTLSVAPANSGAHRRTPETASIDPLRNLSPPQETPENPALLNHAALMTAAQLIGLAEAMLQQASDYAKLRTQFGQPIGAFQAVKHQLASAAVALEFARPPLWVAAQALQDGLPHAAIAISHAKIAAGDAATSIAETAIQVHGAMGYTYEVDLHFWMKRSWALTAAWGDRAFHLARLDAAIIGGGIDIGPRHSFG